MDYDLNHCRFSGKIIELKNIETRTGTPMVSLKLQCWKETIRCVCFNEIAERLLQEYAVGYRIEIAGKLQSSNWENNGTKYFGFQINISDIAGQDIQEDPRAGTEQQTIYPDDIPDHDYRGGPF